MKCIKARGFHMKAWDS